MLLAQCLGTLCLGIPALADIQPAAPETGRYSFQAFRPNPDDARLPPELRRPPAYPEHSSLPRRYNVQIAWSSREHRGLRGYRVTARVDGGPLDGLAAQWRVVAGSGEAVQGDQHSWRYRLLLPLSVDPDSRVEATIEALVEGEALVLLAQRGAGPWNDAGSGAAVEPSPYLGARREALLASYRQARAAHALVASVATWPAPPGVWTELLEAGAHASARPLSADARGPPRC